MLELNKIHLGNNLQLLKQIEDNTVDSCVTDPPYGISFMNKKWDYDVPTVELWKEVYRVLKPGGNILVACGTRTQHRMACNIEDAGFEIRDIVAWVYGSGFPKSKDVSLAIDKEEGLGNRGHRIAVASRHHPDGTTEPNGEKIPPYEAKTDKAKKWEGWGTALKPAMELFTLARKPFKSTVAENVLEWGVGGLNIDGCRVGTEEIKVSGKGSFKEWQKEVKGFKSNENGVNTTHQGRFPSNFIHDGSEEVVALFPNTNAGGSLNKEYSSKANVYGEYGNKNPFESYGDDGTAARFFYTPKASKKERNNGLWGFEEFVDREANRIAGVGCDNPRNRTNNAKRNFHPTVKPLDLMRYLCRLITPKDGIVLEPFAGSGTTCIAAKQEKMNYIGMEIEPEYVDIAKARIYSATVEYSIYDFIGT